MGDEVKIAFTSCMSAWHRPEQLVWGKIQQRKPKALLLLGDLIYMDWGLGASPWPKEVASPTGLDKFRRVMQERYQRQWGLTGFQQLVREVRKFGDHVFATRDDHDFAWNNCTAAGDSKRPEFVPPDVRAVSDLLYRQFVHQLRNPDDPYPSQELPAPLWPSQLLGVDVLLLDQRSYRTHSDDKDATVLGPERLRLETAVAAGTGLMIVGGSTPMEEWPKADSQAFIDAAKKARRPVLYLAGDIHKNRYCGPIAGSSIIQVLSSGAAQPPLWKKLDLPWGKLAPGKFGMLTLDLDASAHNGKVTIELFRMDKAESPTVLTLKQGAWVQ